MDAVATTGMQPVLARRGVDAEKVAAFSRMLNTHNVDTSKWGDRLEFLYWEHQKLHRCALTNSVEQGKLKRVVHLVKIRLLADIFGVEHALFSRLQVLQDGQTINRKQLPFRRLAWKLGSGAVYAVSDKDLYEERSPHVEDWRQGCRRALQDRLGLSIEWQKQHLVEDIVFRAFHVEDNVASRSYPGLHTLYRVHTVVFRVVDTQDAGVRCIGLPHGQEFATQDGARTGCAAEPSVLRPQMNLWTWGRSDPSGAMTIKRAPVPTLSGAALLSLQQRTSQHTAVDLAPSTALSVAQEGRTTAWSTVERMACCVADPDYTLRDYYMGLSAFPELDLYLLDGDVVPSSLRSTRGSEASSGRTIGDEYQRTVGAFFCIYWLMRLNIDGKEGFSFGVDEDWKPLSPKDSDERLYPADKRLAFYRDCFWSEFEDLLVAAELLVRDKQDGQLSVNSTRLMALLALTAIHDVMKIETLLPTVQEGHAPYHGYQAGDTIGDHDHALSYVMDLFPSLLPSFSGLDPEERESVQFTQCHLCFNQGWFVQAEAPPGAIFTQFRKVMRERQSEVRARDIALYFVHWLTDLAGAEPSPLGGCEKFVTRFPLPVLNSFLRSFSAVRQLAEHTETEVTEAYLKSRWEEHKPPLGPVPVGSDAVAKMRLLCMAQVNSAPVLKAFDALPQEDRELLCLEMSRTGCAGQNYSESLIPREAHALSCGPALLVYYGPAYLQSLGSDDAVDRLRVLAEVYRAARALWPESQDGAGSWVTIRVDAIKAMSVADIRGAVADGSRWVMLRKNQNEGFIERMPQQAVAKAPEGISAVQALSIGAPAFDNVLTPPSPTTASCDRRLRRQAQDPDRDPLTAHTDRAQGTVIRD
eukprot:CAMPEP_0195120010 /NCGR_PEP_ID=MMETSP0448-20130528/120835_1 /TAXON_ID=66468 /ORGANISM="Heterocapsa triquestra, Strain CCMP 448" /LENGTH=864 /DNA_ID=CAMNT_0040157399 /DNA_START=179 /DNA_END=2771 /DNA_ORIENTATION=-